MKPKLAILGIDEELLRVMELERLGKAPWCSTRKSINQPSVSRPKPPESVKVKNEFTNQTRNVPVVQEKGGRRYYPFNTVQVGDVFFVPNGEKTLTQNSNALTSNIAYARKKTGFKFTTHRIARGIYVKRIA